VEGDLAEADVATRGDLWADARAALDRAEGRLGTGRWADLRIRLGSGQADLRDRLVRARAALALADRLDTVRHQTWHTREGQHDHAQSDAAYGAVFRDAGLDLLGGDEAEAARQVADSPVRGPLLVALDAWAASRQGHDPAGAVRLLAVARRAGEGGWFDRVRDPELRRDRQRLEELAREPEAARLPPAQAVILAELLMGLGARPAALPVLRAAYRRHPDDFWVNLQLANLLAAGPPARPNEALGYYRAALALRPGNAAVHVNFGLLLNDLGRPAEAEALHRRAIALSPDWPQPHTNLGNALRAQGRAAEAEAAHREALRRHPDDATALSNLGITLAGLGRLAEAEEACREAVELRPDWMEPRCNLGSVLSERGKVAESHAAFREALRRNPDAAWPHVHWANCLHDLGRTGEALPVSRRAVELAPDLPDGWSVRGFALTDAGLPDEAVAAFRRALELKPADGVASNGLGIALSKLARYDEAEAALRRAIELKPDYPDPHGNLANGLQRRGEFAAALAELRRCRELMGPGHPAADRLGVHLRHLERQAGWEADLPAVLRGGVQPADDPDDRVTFGQFCKAKRLFALAARSYADLFAAHPKLAEDPLDAHRYSAACYAALAGAGQGADADRTDAGERGRWRKQALDWLRADLDLIARRLAETPQRKLFFLASLRHSQTDPDLAGVRDAAALAALPADEVSAWLRLWSDVAAVLAKAGQSE
jgi:tetratricopeptide (TPR) repeat protein